MVALPTTEAPLPVTTADYAKGYRALADFLDANPNLKIPGCGYGSVSLFHTFDADVLRKIGRAARRAGAEVTKDYCNGTVVLRLRFGAVTASALAPRDVVCQKVLVGTETVEEEIPDPEAPLVSIPDPLVTKVVTVERGVYDWVCSGLDDES